MMNERSAWFRIGETLVAESKSEITPEQAIEKIREYMQQMKKPEHIHCKDCRWFEPDRHQCGRQICAIFYEDDYCSFAERSTDETD